MKIKALLAATAIAGTGLVGLTAQPAHASCGATLELHNPGTSDVTVDWNQSQVTTNAVVWKGLGTTTTGVDAGDTVDVAVNLSLGCGLHRRYKLRVEDGGASRWVYFPSNSTWTDDETPHIDVD
jgi:hypothetical protein